MKKSIFITGAGSGIGLATAHLFASNGWFVGLFDKNEKSVTQLASQLGKEACCYKALDVTDEIDYKQAVEYFVQHTNGHMDALFNCAGVMFMGPFHKLTLEQHRLTYNVNVMGVVTGIYLCLPYLLKTPDAHVITMGSASGFYGVPDLASYSSSKFAVRGLTEGLSLELEKSGIVVTDLMPLYVNTPMIHSQTETAGTLRSFGASITPDFIASIVWRAAHSRRLHWVPTLRLKFLTLLARFFPFAERSVMKKVGM